jgi:hypothetical protein
MLPFESNSTSRRNINLGGATSQSSQAVLLDRARALRNARRDERNKEVAALRIRNWLLSQRSIQTVRAQLRALYDLGPGHDLLMERGELVSVAFIMWSSRHLCFYARIELSSTGRVYYSYVELMKVDWAGGQ